MKNDFINVKKKSIGALGDGSDDTAAFVAALATGHNVYVPKGVYGYKGGLVQNTPGQKFIGDGVTAVSTDPTRGSVLKKLSGTLPGITVPIYTGNTCIDGICFDQNNLGGSAIVTGMHFGKLGTVVVHNQGGSDYGVKITGSNVSEVGELRFTGTCYGGLLIDKHATAGYSSLYTHFNKVIGGATTNLIKINNATSLTFDAVHSDSVGTVYINDAVKDVTIGRLFAEAEGAEVLNVDGSSGGALRNISVKSGKISCISNGGAIPLIRLNKVIGMFLEQLDILDEFSAANRPYIKLDELYNFAFKGITAENGSANQHYLFLSGSGARSDYGTLENIYKVGPGVITSAMRLGNNIIRNGNVDINFNASSQKMIVENVSGTVDSTNCYNGMIAVGCQSIADTANVVSRIGFEGQTSAMPSDIASPVSGELSLTYISPTGNVYRITGNNNITSISAATSVTNREVTLLFTGSPTVVAGNNIKLAANFAASPDSTLTMRCINGNWYKS